MRYDFKFGDRWLSELGARTTAPPDLEIAQRKIELIEIPGRDGADVIDYGYYGNVEISREIALTGANAEDNLQRLINSFAYLQGYQTFRENRRNGMYTQAVLTNFGDFSRNMIKYRQGVLTFSRLPFWYYDNGSNLKTISWTNNIVSDEFSSDKDGYPLLKIGLPSGGSNVTLKLLLQTDGQSSAVNIALPYSGSSSYVELDCEAGTIVRVQSGTRAQFGFFDRFRFKNKLRIRVTEYKIDSEAVDDHPTVYIAPRWRCL